MTAIQLQDLCNSQYDVDAGICAGYVTAVAEQLMSQSNPTTQICLSPAISPQTLSDHLRRSFEKTPPGAEDLAAQYVIQALRQRFRCP